MKVAVFTITRAATPERLRLLQETLTLGNRTAGMDFDWYVYVSGGECASVLKAARDTKLVYGQRIYSENVGQHVAWNDAFREAKRDRCDYLVRVDDDCEFLTKRWLRKLVDASILLDDRFILAPMVRGLKNPPQRSNKIEIKGLELWFLRDAIGGVCRLHPMDLIGGVKPFVADVRKPLGSGDATGIAAWAKDNVIPFAYLNSVRVRHTTVRQEVRDEEYFDRHDIFQHVPYIPSRGPIDRPAA